MESSQKNYSPLLKWSRRLFLLLLGVVVSLAVLAAGAFLLFDDEDYRDALIQASDLFLDARLEINGRFSLDLARDVSLLAEGVLLRANDGSYSITVGEAQVSQRLGSYLRTGTFWINQLILSDVQLHVRAGDEKEFNLGDVSLPPVIIEQAQFHNLQLFYQERELGKLHELSLLELVLDDVNDSGPVRITGEGLVNGRPLTIDGQLGPLADLVAEGKPYTFQLDMTSGQLEAHVAGTIADPVRGEGVDLQVFLQDPDLSELLKLFDDQAPAIGAVTVRARVSGDYVAPRLDDIEVRLQRGDAVDFTLQGKVDDLMTGSGLELRFSGHSSEPGLLSLLLFSELDEIKSFKVAGQLREQDHRFLVEDFTGNFHSTSGVSIDLSGNTEIPTQTHPQPAGPGNLVMSLSSPTLAALKLPDDVGLPETGVITLKTQLTPFLDGIRLTGLNVGVGQKGHVHTTVRGSIGFISYAIDTGLSAVDLAIQVTSPSTVELGQLFDYPVSELGAVQINMQLTGGTNNLHARDLQLIVGSADPPVIKTSGSIETKLRQHTSTMKIRFDVAVADLVTVFGERPPGDLGRLQGSMEVSDVDGSWGLELFDVESVQTPLYQVHFSGVLDDIIQRGQAEIRLRMEVPKPDMLAVAAGFDLADIAPYQMEGVLTLKNGQLRYTGTTELGKNRSQTTLTGLMKAGKPSLQGDFVIAQMYLDDYGIGSTPSQPAEVKPVEQSAQETVAKRPHLFSREPVNFDALKKLDLDLTISIDEIVSGDLSAKSLHGRIVIEDSILRVAPLHLEAEGGPTDLELEIDARAVPAIVLKLTADDQLLGQWIAQLQGEVPVDGYANYQLDLQTRGATPHELAGNLNGSVVLAFENLRIPAHYIRLLSVDVFGWVLSKAVKGDGYASLDCLLAQFDINEGVATSNLLAADGPRLALEGVMSLDLGAETINAAFIPKQKRRLFSNISPVKLSGDMRAPKVTAIPAREAVASIGGLVLVPAVVIPMVLVEKLWGNVDDKDAYGGGCANLRESKEVEAAKQQKTGANKQLDWFLDD